MSYRKAIACFLAGGLLCAGVASEALAQYYQDDHHGHHWHGDIHHFNEYDFTYWRSGTWVNGFHHGRSGWWWVIGRQWYYYPAPVYPYPDPFIPPSVAPAGPPGQYVYYCPNPAGYYPYVPQCYGPWQGVPQAAPMPPQGYAPPAPQPSYAPAAVAPQPAAAPAMPVPGASQPPSNQRDADDVQLDRFATELDAIKASSPRPLSHLADLHKRIEAFRQTLFTRSYNAMDILQGTEQLEKRLDDKKAAIKAGQQ